ELKRSRFSLPEIRMIVEICRELLGVEHPFASEVLKTKGRDIFVPRNGAAAGGVRRRAAQGWGQVLGPFLKTLDYQDGLACAWWPLGKDRPVVVDPDYGFGFPIMDGTNIRTEIRYERFKAGELSEEIAADFRLDRKQVERALQFE